MKLTLGTFRINAAYMSLVLSGLLMTESLSAQSTSAGSAYENELITILNSIDQSELEKALSLVNQHIVVYPKSRVAYLVKADIMNILSPAGLGTNGGLVPEKKGAEQHKGIVGLRHQLKNRWQHIKENKEITSQKLPLSLLDMGINPHVLVVDMQEGRLYLYKNEQGKPELIKDYYITIGSKGAGKQVEGDLRTPVGVYHFNRYIRDSQLPDLYGKGAFPVNYPNRFDIFKKRTGYGIWLHGTPSDTYARSPWASEGCFVLSNDDFVDISKFVNPRVQTPVILTKNITWVSWQELQQQKASFLAVLDQWKKDWESLDTQAYLAHYKQDRFNLSNTSIVAWAERKTQVNLSKTFVQIDMEVESLFSYPGETDMFIVKYKQHYVSNNYKGIVDKEQYWQKNSAGKWQILYEG